MIFYHIQFYFINIKEREMSKRKNSNDRMKINKSSRDIFIIDNIGNKLFVCRNIMQSKSR